MMPATQEENGMATLKRTGGRMKVVSRRAEPRSRMSAGEWKARQELACCYRVFDHFGWTSLIFNHITVRVPGEEGRFLINPFGLLYSEVTASNLVKIDVDGNIVDDSPYPVNPAGFTIHSAIHAARHDVHAVTHTHTIEGQAVSAQEHGLLPLSMSGLGFNDQIAYHDFEGISLDLDERERLVKDLGDRNILILRNHGLLTCGPTLPDAFAAMWRLQEACEVQVLAQAGGSKLVYPGDSVARRTTAQINRDTRPAGSAPQSVSQMMFDALTRLMIRKDPGFLQ
jgi:ribulose-5-phosphate 4-epimerase/fuculose-1-phosphate aldolase